MERKRLSTFGAVVVILAGASAGCGGSSGSNASSDTTGASSTTSPSSGGSVIQTVTVHETEYKLNPSNISLAKPGTYVFKGVNDGTTDHALAVEGNGLDQDGMHISPGSSGTLKVTIPKAGTYEIYCPVDGHKDLGMKGTITVGGGSSGGTSTEDTTTSSGSGY